jgi:adenosine kinase
MIVTTGSIAFDYIMNYPGRFSDQIMPDKIHVLNLSFLTDRLHKNYGGNAANIAYSLSLLGEKTLLLGTAGRDFNDYKRFLDKAGVDTKYIKVESNEYTSNYFAVVDINDNQLGGFYPGAMGYDDHLSLKSIKTKPDLVIISPTKPEAMVKFSLECQRLKWPYLFDPGMQLPRLNEQDLRTGIDSAEILIGNDYEIGLLMKKTGLSKKKLQGKVPVLITTMAERGALIETSKQSYSIPPAQPESVKDPVGAGDAFRAGFCFGWVRKMPLAVCGRMGAISAIYTVEKEGSTTHSFTTNEFCQRYYKNYHQKISI